MATQSGTQNPDVSASPLQQELIEHPGRFEFFQAVRLLHRLLESREPVGTFAVPDREAVRFTVNNFLGFPPSQIDSLEWAEDEAMPRMKVNFFGLTGPMGVLPHRYTELIRERNRAKDRGLQDFFDLFNHRLIALFYQAWEKYRFYVGYERDHEDRLSRCLMSLVGLGTLALEERQPVRDEAFLFYSGLFSLQPRSAIALEQILADYFNVPVEVEQFVGTWRTLDRTDQCRMLGDIPYSDQLGIGAIAGDEVWDRQSRARIRLGPLTASQYQSFLPNGSAWEPLRALTRFFSNGEIEFELQLVLKHTEVPPCELGSAEIEAPPLLGWFSWVKSDAHFGRNPDDTVLLLN